MTMQRLAALVLTVGTLLVAQPAFAHDHDYHHRDKTEQKEPHGWFKYGVSGMWMGARAGLAIGYLTTGPHYEKGEWREAVGGAAIGALSGVGLGLLMKAIDLDGQQPHAGWLVLRDMSIGTSVGALGGVLAGGIVALGSGRARDMLTGAAIGSLGGGALGLIIGIVQGSRTPTAREPAMALSVSFSPDTGTPMPAMAGHF